MRNSGPDATFGGVELKNAALGLLKCHTALVKAPRTPVAAMSGMNMPTEPPGMKNFVNSLIHGLKISFVRTFFALVCLRALYTVTIKRMKHLQSSFCDI
jgi:hypothetical protein